MVSFIRGENRTSVQIDELSLVFLKKKETEILADKLELFSRLSKWAVILWLLCLW